MDIIEATKEHIPVIQTLSDIVWPHTFKEILSADQISYMMNMMYSTEALDKQMDILNHHYLLAQEDGQYWGYLAYELNYKGTFSTKIHKIYVLPTSQGKGLGRIFINSVKDLAIRNGNTSLLLNVNRFNKAIDFYQRMGFEIIDNEDIDIGDGFLMEDYVMSKKL